MDKVIVDVRECDEFEAEHVANSINVPLSSFNTLAPGVFANLKDRDISIMCLSGGRAKRALIEANGLGFIENLETYNGGITAWKKSGNPTLGNVKNNFPIMRQVQLSMGFVAFISVALGFLVSPTIFYVAGFVALGMMFAGATGNCALADVLAKMPWNKVADSHCESGTTKTGTETSKLLA